MLRLYMEVERDMSLTKNRVCICCGETRPARDFNRASNPNVCQSCAGLVEETEFFRRPQVSELKPAESPAPRKFAPRSNR